MTREVQEIPPAPRPARIGAVLWFRWPLALLGVLLAVYGGLWTLMFLFHSGGKASEDRLLDQDPARATGEVLGVESVPETLYFERAERVRYAFTDARGTPVFGQCFVEPGRCRKGHEVDVEYVTGSSHVNRVRGGRLCRLSDFVTPAFRVTVVPGTALLLFWLWSVLRLHRILVHGDIAVAELREVRRLPVINPAMLSVRFRFRDHHARVCDGHHWVRERSTLGARLCEQPLRLAVVHDRRRPSWHRLVVPEHFQPTRPAPDKVPSRGHRP